MITLEELENQPFVQAHPDLYKNALERGKFSDRAFWDDLDFDEKEMIRKQMKQYGSKPVWRKIC